MLGAWQDFHNWALQHSSISMITTTAIFPSFTIPAKEDSGILVLKQEMSAKRESVNLMHQQDRSFHTFNPLG